MDGLTYLFFAYTIIWALTFGYLVYLSQKERGLRREIDSLKKIIEKQTRN